MENWSAEPGIESCAEDLTVSYRYLPLERAEQEKLLGFGRMTGELLKRGVNERQRTCALFLITVFIRFVVVDVLFLALNHFHAQKYEEEGGTSTVLP
jgi:hypothetical protein